LVIVLQFHRRRVLLILISVLSDLRSVRYGFFVGAEAGGVVAGVAGFEVAGAEDEAGGACAGLEVAGAGCEVAGACEVGCWLPGSWPVGSGLWVGCCAAGVVAGAGFGAGLETFCRTEPLSATALSVRRVIAKEQTMNMMAHQVVALERTLAAPRGPKAV